MGQGTGSAVGGSAATAPSERDPTLVARAEELRRIVYGTPDGHRSPAAAELVEVERALVASARAGDPGGGAGGSGGSSAADPRLPGDAAHRRRPRLRRRILLLGIAVALIATGAIVSAAIRAADEPARGLAVFDRPQTDADTGLVGYEEQLGRRAATLRNLGTVLGHEAWVFLERGDVCLIVQREQWAGWGGTCVDRRTFDRHGITRLLTYDELSGRARPAGLVPGEGVELRWGPASTGVEWRVVGGSIETGARERVWVPTLGEPD